MKTIPLVHTVLLAGRPAFIVKVRYLLFSVQPMSEVFVKTSFADKSLPVVVGGIEIK